jgi:hypothetical protein
MRGAPQVGFSETIRKIKARTSLLTRFRPPTWLTLETHVQYKQNPARRQFTTVLGVTKMSGLAAWSTRTRTFATQPRTACAGQLIDGEVVARAEPAIADGEPGSRGRGPPGNGKRLTTSRGNVGAIRSWPELYRKSPNRALRQVIHSAGVRFGEAQAVGASERLELGN